MKAQRFGELSVDTSLFLYDPGKAVFNTYILYRKITPYHIMDEYYFKGGAFSIKDKQTGPMFIDNDFLVFPYVEKNNSIIVKESD